MAKNKLNLLADYPPVSTEEWMAKITADLKGADFDKKLVWKTNEGSNVRPVYRANDIEGLKTTDLLPGEFPYVRGTKTDNNWLTIKALSSAGNHVCSITSIGLRMTCKSTIFPGYAGVFFRLWA